VDAVLTSRTQFEEIAMNGNEVRVVEFVSVVGVFPLSVITPAMATALDTVDDNGEIRCSTQTLKRLVQYGLVTDKRLLGILLTHAGWNVLATLPLRPLHRTQTWETGEARLNWRNARMESSRTAAWSCSCGKSGSAASRSEARAGAKRHREQ
jgi:hypothetical protein